MKRKVIRLYDLVEVQACVNCMKVFLLSLSHSTLVLGMWGGLSFECIRLRLNELLPT